MENCNLSSLPSSLKFLTKLCMLNLGGNKSLVDISIILNDTGIKNVPEEIGKLANLRFFEVKGCQNLSHIAPGVISKLYWLEELHIGFYVKGSTSSLLELNSLGRLTFLDLLVIDFTSILEGVNFEKIKGFVIQIGTSEPSYLSPWVSQDISPKSVAKLNSVIPKLYYGSSNEFRSILLSECNDVTCLVDKRIPGGKDMKDMFLSELEHLDLSQLNRLNVIWKCQDKYISFGSLTTLNIDNCPKLQKLFPVRVAKGLVNLERLSIKYCVFKSVIVDESETEQAFELGHLAEISLYSLPHFESFSSENFNIKYPALVKVSISSCSRMSVWGNGVHVSMIHPSSNLWMMCQ
ncbi:NB-ARC domains-containing protein [Tanacetum coccineum]|uniref:NB-ARC domains-containing protein n=1 Tax=Tanacetum coccineum TaxID=301880 RepID=A0ABQ4WTD8_9ASTR